jgi:hypothetical protein
MSGSDGCQPTPICRRSGNSSHQLGRSFLEAVLKVVPDPAVERVLRVEVYREINRLASFRPFTGLDQEHGQIAPRAIGLVLNLAQTVSDHSDRRLLVEQ